MKRVILIFALACCSAFAQPTTESRITSLETRIGIYEKVFFGFSFSFLTALIGLFGYAAKRSRKAIDKINANLEGEFTNVMKMLEAFKTRDHLKSEPILVLSPNKVLGPELRDLGFKNVTTKPIDRNGHTEAMKAKLVIVDGTTELTPDEQGWAHDASKLTTTVVFWPKGRCPITGENVTFCNSKITLFARAMEALAFIKQS